MKTRRLAMALDIGSTESIKAHAAGFVSRMIVRRDGLCSTRVSHPSHSRMLLESDTKLTYRWQFVTEVLRCIGSVHDHRRLPRLGFGGSCIEGRLCAESSCFVEREEAANAHWSIST